MRAASTALPALLAREQERFVAAHPGSGALARQARAHWLHGVPMHWMLDWPTPHPLFVRSAQGAHLTDVDGLDYTDFCLGDSAALFGHSPPSIARALSEQAARGAAAMLADERVAECGELLSRLFGLPVWQLSLSATDANRAALRYARAATGRQRIVVFDGCYHGTVDESMVRLRAGATVARPGQVAPAFDLAVHTTAVPFNDIEALTAALAANDIAAVLCEPLMTNAGMVLPAPGFHAALRQLCTRHGSLLIIDETHTLSSGLGGYTRVAGLSPDMLVCGKAIAGGVACAVLGFSAETAAHVQRHMEEKKPGHSGLGTTLAANLLSVAALHASLRELMTAANYARMERQAARLAAGLSECCAHHRRQWIVQRAGARLEIACAPTAPRNAVDSEASMQPDLERLLHLYLLNRGVLMTPFHNMLLVSPATGERECAGLLAGWQAALAECAA